MSTMGPGSGTGSAAPGGTRAAFLADLMTALAADHAHCAAWGSDTDVTITSNPVDPRWGAGDERAVYAAALKVTEPDRVVYFWEALKDRSQADDFDTFESETDPNATAAGPGANTGAAIGPGSTSWEWGYGTLRRLVEDVAARHGFTVHVVLVRREATW